MHWSFHTHIYLNDNVDGGNCARVVMICVSQITSVNQSIPKKLQVVPSSFLHKLLIMTNWTRCMKGEGPRLVMLVNVVEPRIGDCAIV